MRLAVPHDIVRRYSSAHSNPNGSGDVTFAVKHRDHEVRLTVCGELDLAALDLVVRAVAYVLQPSVRVLLLDLDGVGFCDAAGVTALVKVRRATVDAEVLLVLTGVGRQVRYVLDLVGISRVMPIARNRAIERTTMDSPGTGTVDPPESPDNTPTVHLLLAPVA
jgi:anti-anti-sigma factor